MYAQIIHVDFTDAAAAIKDLIISYLGESTRHYLATWNEGMPARYLRMRQKNLRAGLIAADQHDAGQREFGGGADFIPGRRIFPRRRTDRLHAEHRAAQQHAAMVELATDQGAGLVDRLGQVGKARDEAIVEDAERGAMIARIAGDHHGLGDDHRGAAARPLGIVDLVALGREAV